MVSSDPVTAPRAYDLSVGRARSRHSSEAVDTTANHPAPAVVAVSVVDAVVTAEDSLEYGGVDSDEYDESFEHTDDSIRRVSGTIQLDVPADAAELLAATAEEKVASEASEAETVTDEERVEEEQPQQLADVAKLLSKYSQEFIEKRDFDPSHIHPAAIGYQIVWQPSDSVTARDGNPALTSPVFLVANW